MTLPDLDQMMNEYQVRIVCGAVDSQNVFLECAKVQTRNRRTTGLKAATDGKAKHTVSPRPRRTR